MNVFELYVSLKISIEALKNGLNQANKEVEVFENKTTSKFDSLKSAASKTFATIGKVAAAGIAAATAAAIKLGKEAVAAYGEYEQLTGGVKKLFGTQGLTIEQYAESVGKSVSQVEAQYKKLQNAENLIMENAADAYEKAGMSTNAYLQNITGFSATLLKSLEGDSEEAVKIANMAMQDISDNANTYGKYTVEELANVYTALARGNYTTVDNLMLGYGGSAQEMFKLMTDAAKINKEFAKSAQFSLDAKGHLEADFSDIIKAIHIVQENLNITGTTEKEAATTLQGSINMTKAAWENLVAGLANPDADIQKLCQNVIDSFNNLLNNITPIIENVIKTLPSAVKTLADNFVKLLPTLLKTATSLFREVLSSLITLLPELAKYAFDAVMTIVNTILENLPAIGEMAIQIILTLVNGISEALPTLIPTAVKVILSLIEVILDNLPLILDCALSLIEAFANGIIAAIPILLKKLPILITKLLDFLVGSIPTITQAGIEIFTSLIKELPTIIELLCAAIPKIIVALIAAIKESEVLITQAGQDLLIALIDNLPTIISSLIIGIITLITSLVNAICDDKNLEIFAKSGVELFLALIGNLPIILIELAKAVPKIIEAVAEAFFDNEYKFTDAGNNIVRGIWKGINELAPWLLNKVSEWVGGIWNEVRDWLGIASPSKKMAWIGQMMVKGLSNSIADNGDEAVRAAETMTKNIADTVNGISDTDFNVNLNRNIIPQNDSGNNYTTQNSGHYSIVVNIANMNANSESDIEDLADRLMRIMEEKTVRRGSVFA